MYPHESSNTILFPLLILVLFTLFIGSIGIPFNGGVINVDLLSKWLTPSTIIFHPNFNSSEYWYEFLSNAFFSVSIKYSSFWTIYSIYFFWIYLFIFKKFWLDEFLFQKRS